MKPIFTALAAAAFALSGAAAAASPTEATPEPTIDRAPSAEAMTFDLFIMRPLGLVGAVAGTAIYIVSLPFDVIAGNVSEPARRLVGEPLKFTFTRPLGDLD